MWNLIGAHEQMTNANHEQMIRCTSKGLPWIVVAVVLCAPAEVCAGGIPILVTWGESVERAGPVHEKHSVEVQQITRSNVSIGFVYSRFGIFWLNVWTWNGRYCLYDEKGHWDLTKRQAAALLDRTENELGNPFFYTFPPGLFIFPALAFAYYGYSRMNEREQHQRLVNDAALLHQARTDPRYREALRIYSAQPSAADSPALTPTEIGQQRFVAAVDSLVSNGLSRPDAERGFFLLLYEIQAEQEMQRISSGVVEAREDHGPS